MGERSNGALADGQAPESTPDNLNLDISARRFVNPYRLHRGKGPFRIPDWLASRQEVSPIAKLIYTALIWHGRGNGPPYPEIGRAYPEHEVLAAEIGGASIRTVQRAVLELKAHRLVHVSRTGRACSYYFPRHPWMGEQKESVIGQYDRSDRSICGIRSVKLAGRICKEKGRSEGKEKTPAVFSHDYSPPENTLTWAAERCPDADVDRALERWRNHLGDVPFPTFKFADGRFRNWLLDDQKRAEEKSRARNYDPRRFAGVN